MGQGDRWGDARDRRLHGRLLVVLLAALTLAAALPPAAGALRAVFVDSHQPLVLLGPSVTGDPRVGGTLSCDRGTWDDSDAAPYEYRYIWMHDEYGEPIEDAQASTYVVTADDAGQTLVCAVIAVNGREDNYRSTDPILVRVPENRSAPRMTGDPRIGGLLGCTRGVWDDRDLAPYPTAFAWTRDGELIEGAETDTYVVTADDLDTALSCEVTAAAFATASATTFPKPPQNRVLPVLGGDLRIGGAVTCSRGGWDDEGRTAYPVTYQWLRDGEPIELAALAGYTVGLLDAGHELSCRVVAAGLSSAETLPLTPREPSSRNAPRVSGDLRLGHTLTCDPGAWDADYPFEYAWLRDGVQIATGATHVNVAADLGVLVQCRVSAHGRTTVTSTGVYPTAPEVRSLPSLTGDARLGRTLTCGSGDWDDSYAYTYEWLRDGASAATGPTYALAVADVGHEVACRVRAAGLTSADSRAVVAPQPRALAAPAISGDPRVGQTLTCGRGTWDDPATPYAVTYAWFRGDGTPLGAGATRTVVNGDTVLFCRVTAAGLVIASSANVTVSDPAGGAVPENRSAPVLTGTPRLRGTLDCAPGSWAGASSFSYRWLRDGAAVGTQTSYVVVAADVGHGLRCEVQSGTTVALSQTVTPTAPAVLNAPDVSGDPRVRRTLRCSSGSWDGPYAFTYQWLRGATQIATGDALVLGAADVGQPIACRVQADGLTVATSAAVTVRAPRNLVAPSVGGDPRIGRTLTCDPGGWDDLAEDRYAIAYRWFRDGLPLAGETAPTHAVVAADLTKPLTCEARAETSTAVSSAGVVAAAPANRLPPALSGTGRLGSVLTCGDGEWDGSYPITRRWLRDVAPIAGETGMTYTVRVADLGEPLYCETTAAGLTAASSTALTPSEPALVHAPQIEGDHRIGTTLTCTRGEWDDTAAARYAVSYRWLRDGAPAGTLPTLAVTAADATHAFVCEVTAEGRTVAATPEVTVDEPGVLTPPRVMGSPQLRGELECARGTWDDTAAARYAVTYQWYRDDVAIGGATSPTRQLGRGDLKGVFSCSVTAEGLTEERSDAVEVPEPEIVGSWPSVDGQAYVGRQVLCDRGEWNDREGLRYAVSFRWERDSEGWRPIAGADGESYTVTGNDVDRGLRCVVTAEGEWTVAGYQTYGNWQPVETAISALDDSVAPGAANGYRLTLTNPATNDAVLRYAYINLPAGFTYTPGSTTGATTADPTVSVYSGAQYLQFNQGLLVPAGGEITIAIAVKASSVVGDHYASGGGQTPGYSPWVNGTTGAHIATELPFDVATCTISGTAGDDVLTGTAGDDVICGLAGNDVLRGAGGNDVLVGGDGDDRLDGGDGDDTLLGGRGDDIVLAGAGADVMRGGGGLDTVNYSARTTPVRITLGGDDGIDDDNAVVAHDDGTYVRVDDDGDGEIDDDDPIETREGDDVGGDFEIVRGGRGDDFIVGSFSDEEIYGGAGRDFIDPQAGSNLVDGGDGDDRLLSGWNAHERMFCGAGNDLYRADVDEDLVVGCEIYWNSEGVG